MCLAVPGQIQEIYESLSTRMGKVSFGGIVKEVCLAYLPEIAVGVGIVIEERSLLSCPMSNRHATCWAWTQSMRRMKASWSPSWIHAQPMR